MDVNDSLSEQIHEEHRYMKPLPNDEDKIELGV